MFQFVNSVCKPGLQTGHFSGCVVKSCIQVCVCKMLCTDLQTHPFKISECGEDSDGLYYLGQFLLGRADVEDDDDDDWQVKEADCRALEQLKVDDDDKPGHYLRWTATLRKRTSDDNVRDAWSDRNQPRKPYAHMKLRDVATAVQWQKDDQNEFAWQESNGDSWFDWKRAEGFCPKIAGKPKEWLVSALIRFTNRVYKLDLQTRFTN